MAQDRSQADCHIRPVGAGGAIPPPDFGRSIEKPYVSEPGGGGADYAPHINTGSGFSDLPTAPRMKVRSCAKCNEAYIFPPTF